MRSIESKDIEKKINENSKNILEYRKKIFKVFNTDDGKDLLKIWEKEYFYSPSFNPKEHDKYIYIREGQNNFLRKILTDINLHKMFAKNESTDFCNTNL